MKQSNSREFAVAKGATTTPIVYGRFKRTIAALMVSAAFASTPAWAAGLGKLTVLSGLGQPLRAEIEVVALQRGEVESLQARVAPIEAYQQANVEFSAALQQLRFNVERRTGNRVVVTMTSVTPINDPFVDVLVELNWATGRLVREYTFLLDPAEYKPPVDVAVRPPVVAAPARVEPAPAAVPAPPGSPQAAAPAPSSAPLATPPVAAAERPAAQAPTAVARSGDYQVRQGDTLARIAQANVAPGVTLQQMLMALYRANEDAFDGKNINRLRAGRILTIPSVEQAQSVAADEAQRVVIAQAQEWNAYRQQLAGAVARGQARADGAGQTAQGRITARVDDAKPPAGDRLSLATPDRQAGQGDSAIANQRAVKEAQSRVTDLEKTVRDLQQALTLKNDELARLQKSAQATKPPAISKPPAIEVPPPVTAAVPPALTGTPTVDVKPPAMDPPTPQVVTPPAATPPVAVAPPKPPAVKPPATVSEPSFVDQIVEFVSDFGLYIAGAIAALGLALFGWMRLRKRKQDALQDSLLGTPSTGDAASSVFGGSGGRSVDTGSSLQTDFSQSGIGSIDTEEVDPVAEADVYMAYGRDAQAEEILKEALQKDPNRHTVRVKLLEIYGARKDLSAFETTAGELFAATGGTGPDWERASALGAQIDPSNPMYGGGRAAVADVVPIRAAATAATAAGVAGAAIAAAKAGAASIGPGPRSRAPALDEIPHVDLDLDLPSQSNIPDIALNADSMSRAPLDLGFDLNLGDPSILSPRLGARSDAPLSMMPSLDLELPSLSPAPSAAGRPLELDFAVGGGASKAPLDLGGISLDMGAPSMGGSAPVDARWQEVATKLDLAKAYHEMGDRDGARELLSEVINEGDGSQQQQAKKLLESIA